jgi:hypothetical protein
MIDGFPTIHMMHPTSSREIAHPVAMLFVMALPLPKSTNFAALGATPSASSGVAQSCEALRRVVSLRILDIRGTEGAENKGHRPTLRQPSKCAPLRRHSQISRAGIFRRAAYASSVVLFRRAMND